MTIQFKQLNTWHLNIKTPLVLPSSKIIINSFFLILNFKNRRNKWYCFGEENEYPIMGKRGIVVWRTRGKYIYIYP
jgi:hypothetical protein